MGGGVGRWPMEGGQGGRWGGAPESSGSNKGGLVPPSLKNLTTGLIWLVTRVGGWGRRGEVAHGGRARGGDGGGHQRAVWEQQKVHWFTLLGSLKNLSTGLIWLVTRLEGWGEAWGKGALVPPFGLSGGGMGGGVGRWPMEGGQGGSPFWAP